MSIAIKIMRNLYSTKYRSHTSLLRSITGLQKPRRYLHVSSKLCIKMFMEHENKYAYSILESKGHAISLDLRNELTTISKEEFENLLKIDWSKQPTERLLDVFPKLGDYCSQNNTCISDTVFDNYIDNLTDSIKTATDKELETLFYSLCKWPETTSIRSRNFIEVWVALDDVCLSRINQWTIDQMLSFVALFYMLNVSRVSDFTLKALQKMASKAKQLSPGQLVQAMFFVGVIRKQPFDMHNFEIQLYNIFSMFSVDDLAIISMGFFKSKTPIRSLDLVCKIIDIVMENSKNIHEVSLAALLKVIRYSMKINQDDKVYRMLDTLQHEVPRLSVMCNVHMALVGTATLTLHEGCLTKIADTIIDSISNTRVKDLERLVLTYGTFNLIPQTTECFFTKVINELRKTEREEEILKHGRSFACCISYLNLIGIYPTDLMNKVLSPEFLENAYGKQCYNYGREILTINNTAELFCGGENMNLLPEKNVKILARKYTDFVPSEDYKKQYNITEKMVLDVMRVLKHDRGGDEYVTGGHIVSHHQRGDIVVCNKPDGQPVTVTEIFRNKTFGLLQRPPDNNIWTAIVIVGRNAIIHNSNTPTGHFFTKSKELKALGFRSTLVPWSIYTKFETIEEKSHYLNKLIKQANDDHKNV